MHITNADKFTAADNDLPSKSEMTLVEAAEARLLNETEEEQTDSRDLTIRDTNEKASMSRTDASHITEGLWSIIQQGETQAQNFRLI